MVSSQVFNVEATGQYRKLFKLYAIKGAGGGTGLEDTQEKVDIREVRTNRETFFSCETRGLGDGRWKAVLRYATVCYGMMGLALSF